MNMIGSYRATRIEKKLQRLLKILQPRVLARLTYPQKFPSISDAIQHLDQFLEYLGENDNKGMWFLVFQERGAPYFYLVVSKYIPKEEIAQKWFNIVGSGDPAHLRAGTSVSGFQFYRGASQFLEKIIFPFIKKPDFKYGTFGNLKAKIFSFF